jgi:predicted aspartyl protease
MTYTPVSRRRFAGFALAALPVMTGLLQAQPVGPLTITVTIDGRGPFRFVVDTGADRSVLADTTVQALGLRAQGAVLLAGIVRTVRAETVTVATMAFGDQIRHDLALPVLPRALLQADGYLGLDVLDGYRVVLDFAAQELAVAEPLPVLYSVYRAPDVTVLNAQGSSGHLRAARCSVNRQPVAAFIDTGAESSMGNEALYRALITSDPSLRSHSTIALTGLTGGMAIGRLIHPREAQLGRITITNCPIAIADLQVFDIWGLAERPALVIGMNWLRRFKRVQVDYARKELRFEIGSAWSRATA